jgi:hypothetical protein
VTGAEPLVAYWTIPHGHDSRRGQQTRRGPAAATPVDGISPLQVLTDAELDTMGRVIDVIATRRTQAEAAGFQFVEGGPPQRMASESRARAPRGRRTTRHRASDFVGVMLDAIIGRAHESRSRNETASTAISERPPDAIQIFDLLGDEDLAIAREGYACLERRCRLASAHGIVFRE